MDVPVREFYKEVTGKSVTSTNTALHALDRWNVPYFSNTPKGSEKMFWRADIKHIEYAKNAQAKINESKTAKKVKKPKTNRQLDPHAPDREGFTLMQRMANLEQEVRTLNATLDAFVKSF